MRCPWDQHVLLEAVQKRICKDRAQRADWSPLGTLGDIGPQLQRQLTFIKSLIVFDGRLLSLLEDPNIAELYHINKSRDIMTWHSEELMSGGPWHEIVWDPHLCPFIHAVLWPHAELFVFHRVCLGSDQLLCLEPGLTRMHPDAD